MSKSFMEKLLEGASVEWKALGSVADIGTGSSNRQDEDASGIYPFYVRSKTVLKSDTFEFDEVAIIIPGEGGIGDIFHYVEGKYALHQRAYRIRITLDTVDTKFLYHFMRSGFKQYILLKSVGATAISIRKPMIEGFCIPIPPLPVQVEIVRILDAFTELTAELTAELASELTARKKQYNYYRDQLLSFEEGEVEWKTLGEIGNLVRGNGLPKTDFTESGVPAIHYGQIYTYYGLSTLSTKSFVSSETANKLKKVNKGDVIITNTSENLEDVGKAVLYLGEQQAVTGGHATIFKPSKIILGKYFVYCTQTNFFADEKRKYAKGTKVIDVSANDMAKIQIPIPPLAEQERIVDILDKFDALTSSISEGLPREIELRQKQYEYYRELLLSFPKAEVGPT
ncbi:type I restriction modification DNA specificity domain protein [Leptospira interrogans serovar Bulgarica str. Mallika]|nr:restriction endonuclease subunit S [Leptospira interrogans]EJP04856.1 type I restriction modification DNA specificity domain protein [Leptospira interrogans serovar Bulgarica str. Mallika]